MSDSSVSLRGYQVDTVDSALESKSRRVLIQSPTSTGKNYMIAETARKCVENGERVLCLEHRVELVMRLVEDLKRFGLTVGVIQAGKRHLENDKAQVQVAGVQTLARRTRQPKTDMVLIDECHHTPAKTYQRILAKHPNARVIGLTATPLHLAGLGPYFDEIISTGQIADFIKSGHRAGTTGKVWVGKQLLGDLSNVKRKGSGESKDFETGEIGEVMSRRHIVGPIVSRWKKYAKGLSTILYAATRAQSEVMVAAFRKAGVSAESVDGETRPEERSARLLRFANGEFNVLCNVGVLTEGFDCPRVKCIILARPTYSLGLFLQMVGRGARSWGNKKCVVHDHGNLIAQHGHPDEDRDWSLGGKSKKTHVVCPKCHTARDIEEPRCPEGCKFTGVATQAPQWVLRGYEYELEQFAAMRNGRLEKAKGLYSSGKTSPEIGKALGVAPSTVRDWLRLSGVQIRRQEPDATIVSRSKKLYLDGMTCSQVAAAVGSKECTIASWGRKGGWIRTKSEASTPDPKMMGRAKKLYLERISPLKIGKIIGVGGTTVRSWVKKLGWLRIALRDSFGQR